MLLLCYLTSSYVQALEDGGYHCTCPDGYGGKHCELSDVCTYNAACRHGICYLGRCVCFTGYHGKHCEYETQGSDGQWINDKTF